MTPSSISGRTTTRLAAVARLLPLPGARPAFTGFAAAVAPFAQFEPAVAGSRVLACGRVAEPRLGLRSDPARRRGVVVDLGPDHDARLAAVAPLLQLLAAGRRDCDALEPKVTNRRHG